jgi:ADP-ribose pyrophosphatase
MTDSRVHILDKTVCYDGFFRIQRYRLRHQLFRGGWSREITRELFERGHAAAVLPYDPLLDAVVLIEQFRIGALETPGDPWLLEIGRCGPTRSRRRGQLCYPGYRAYL